MHVLAADTSGSTRKDLVGRDAAVIADALRMRYTSMDIASGEGAWLTDSHGRQYLDFGAGWALAGLGYSFIGPEEGWLACRNTGPGRLSEPAKIVETITRMLTEPGAMPRPIVTDRVEAEEE